MKKYLIIALCIVMLIGTFQMPIYALEQNVTVSYDAETGKVFVSGTSDSPVVMIVINSGDTPLASLADDNLPVALDAAVVTDGSFSSEIIMPNDANSGKHSVYLTGDRAINIDEEFIHLNLEMARAPFENTILGEEDDTAFELAVTSSAEIFGIDVTDEFYINNKTDIIDLLVVIRQDYTSAYELYNDYYKAYALMRLKGSSESNIEYIFQKYKKQLGVDLDSFTSSLSSDSKGYFMNILSEVNYADELESDSLNTFLQKSAIVAQVATAENGTGLMELIENKYSSEFATMISGDEYYNSIPLSSRYMVYNEMMNSTYNKYKDISAAFESASQKVYTDIYGNINTGNTGAGGGGFGGGVSIAPQIPPAPSSNNSLSDEGIPILPANASSSFSDVSKDDWFYNAVSTLSQLQIANGYSDNSFGPTLDITRAEFTKLVYTAFVDALPEIPEDAEEIVFSDVSRNDWYYYTILDAAMSGLIQGSDSKFNPDEPIKREDAALIIYNAFRKMGVEIAGVPTYDDKNDVSIYAYTAVGALSKYSIMKGYDNEFRPLDKISRAEAAQLIYNSLNHLQPKEDKGV